MLIGAASILLTNVLLLLAEHQSFQDRAAAEARALLSTDEAAQPPSLEEVRARLTFCEFCIREALRFRSIAPSIVRCARASDSIPQSAGRPPVAVNGGQFFLLYYAARHRDTAAWGDQPTQYLPTRWETSSTAGKGPADFLAFGRGAKGCPGSGLAILEATYALAQLLASFRFNLHNNQRLATLQLKNLGVITPAELVNLEILPRS